MFRKISVVLLVCLMLHLFHHHKKACACGDICSAPVSVAYSNLVPIAPLSVGYAPVGYGYSAPYTTSLALSNYGQVVGVAAPYYSSYYAPQTFSAGYTAFNVTPSVVVNAHNGAVFSNVGFFHHNNATVVVNSNSNAQVIVNSGGHRNVRVRVR